MQTGHWTVERRIADGLYTAVAVISGVHTLDGLDASHVRFDARKTDRITFHPTITEDHLTVDDTIEESEEKWS